jgi:hypothetical protein
LTTKRKKRHKRRKQPPFKKRNRKIEGQKIPKIPKRKNNPMGPWGGNFHTATPPPGAIQPYGVLKVTDI